MLIGAWTLMLCSNWGCRYRQQHPEMSMAARMAAQGMAAGLPVMVPAGYAYGSHPHMHMPQVPPGFAHYHHLQSVPGNAFYPHRMDESCTVSRGFN